MHFIKQNDSVIAHKLYQYSSWPCTIKSYGLSESQGGGYWEVKTSTELDVNMLSRHSRCSYLFDQIYWFGGKMYDFLVDL